MAYLYNYVIHPGPMDVVLWRFPCGHLWHSMFSNTCLCCMGTKAISSPGQTNRMACNSQFSSTPSTSTLPIHEQNSPHIHTCTQTYIHTTHRHTHTNVKSHPHTTHMQNKMSDQHRLRWIALGDSAVGCMSSGHPLTHSPFLPLPHHT